MGLTILFVMRSGAHFPYHATTIQHLVRRGHQVRLLFDPVWNTRGPIAHRALQDWLARGPTVDIGDFVQRSDSWRKVLLVTREARSYASYARRGPAVEFYRARWKGYLPSWLQRLAETPVGSWAFRRRLTRYALTAVERVAPADARIVAALTRERPDCVIASPANMRFDQEVEYLKAARALRIPAIIPVLSWDNLTTKGLFHVQPDLVLAWHKGHRHEARTIHGVPSARVVITGSPFFDKWFDSSRPISSRTETCRRLELDPARPYVVYLGSSVNIAGDESWLVVELDKALRGSRDPAVRKLQLVFKPHPANLRALPRLDQANIPVWPREHGLPDTVETAGQFRDLLHHATCAVGVNTTGMVDAILCDRPCIAIVVKQYRATQAETVHFQRMVQSKALYVAESVTHTAKLAARLGGGRDPRADRRRKFMEVYARPRGLGADAGEAAALAIEHLVRGVPAAEIPTTIDRQLAGRPVPARPRVEPEPRPTPSYAIRRTIDKARRRPVFRHYERVRDLVLRMMDESHDGYSAYWKQEVRGFDYMFDASPLVIARLREHTHHITGVRSYEYRDHHAEKRAPFAFKLERLREADSGGLFVPESPELGGFGHEIEGALVNLDTLKFYECLIGLDRAGALASLRASSTRRLVVEIGAGWGGFAYQFKSLFPNTTYVIVDLPPTMLFSATYLKATFPDARLRIYGECPDGTLFGDLDRADFIFVPPHAFARMPKAGAELAVNIASFQEMTTAQVAGYVDKLADTGCPVLYSLNRDRSPYNHQLSSVTEIIARRYRLDPIEVLPVPYTVLTWRPEKVVERSATDYRHLIGRQACQGTPG